MIYFLGDRLSKTFCKAGKSQYDSSDNYYKINTNDHIFYRYELLDVLGCGAFGQVVKVFDHKEKDFKAIKIIRSKETIDSSTEQEVRLLRYIHSKDPQTLSNYAKFYESFMFRNHLCIVIELLSIDLYTLMQKIDFAGIPLGLARRFAE